MSVLVVIGVGLACAPVFAQDGIIPSNSRFGEGSINNSIPYNSYQFANVCFYQYASPSEFCPGPIPPQGQPASGLVAPMDINGLGIHCDGWIATWGPSYNSTSSRPDSGTTHYFTDMQSQSYYMPYYDYWLWNATTTAYPGGYSFACPYGLSDNRSYPAQEEMMFPSMTGGFTYTGYTTCSCGSCPYITRGGLVIGFRGLYGSSPTSYYFYVDHSYTYCRAGNFPCMTRRYGIWSNGGNTGYSPYYYTYWGNVYYLLGQKCETFNDLKDKILEVEIVGNPPSNQTPQSQPGGPYYKNDSGIGGIRNSLWKQVINAEAAYNRGQLHTAGNGLDAFNNHLEAQDGKHVVDAGPLQECCAAVRSNLGI